MISSNEVNQVSIEIKVKVKKPLSLALRVLGTTKNV